MDMKPTNMPPTNLQQLCDAIMSRSWLVSICMNRAPNPTVSVSDNDCASASETDGHKHPFGIICHTLDYDYDPTKSFTL